jgi:hypothetical protein
MSYIVWALIGVVVAVVVGADARKRSYAPNSNAALFSGAFGAILGGIVGDGVPHAFPAPLTLTSVVGAVIGAAIFAWAVRARFSDSEY